MSSEEFDKVTIVCLPLLEFIDAATFNLKQERTQRLITRDDLVILNNHIASLQYQIDKLRMEKS